MGSRAARRDSMVRHAGSQRSSSAAPAPATAGARASRATPLRLILGWWALCMLLFLSGWPIQYQLTNVAKVMALVGVSADGGQAGRNGGATGVPPIQGGE